MTRITYYSTDKKLIRKLGENFGTVNLRKSTTVVSDFSPSRCSFFCGSCEYHMDGKAADKCNPDIFINLDKITGIFSHKLGRFYE